MKVNSSLLQDFFLFNLYKGMFDLFYSRIGNT